MLTANDHDPSSPHARLQASGGLSHLSWIGRCKGQREPTGGAIAEATRNSFLADRHGSCALALKVGKSEVTIWMRKTGLFLGHRRQAEAPPTSWRPGAGRPGQPLAAVAYPTQPSNLEESWRLARFALQFLH